jgi:peptidoglycan/xylan/chitin deacetylase (PgdA/CDA1 family)
VRAGRTIAAAGRPRALENGCARTKSKRLIEVRCGAVEEARGLHRFAELIISRCPPDRPYCVQRPLAHARCEVGPERLAIGNPETGFAMKNIKIRNKAVLKAIFAIKKRWSIGVKPERRVFDGIEIAPLKNDAKAAACISADLELSWAFRMQPVEMAEQKGRYSRENIPYLLRTFEKWAFPITWATVGHLFLESCERYSSRLAHPEMPRPRRNELWTGDWYRHDPCTSYEKDPCWYAPDVIHRILENPVDHEIGTHSFSHIDFSCSYSDPILVRREIEESAAAMQRFGLSPRSLVYPFNNAGDTYLDLLSELSITAVRHRDPCVRLSYPDRSPSGVYRIHESMHLRTSKHYECLDKVKIFLTKAAERHAVFHLWFHPSDPPYVFERELPRILQFIASEREKGLVWIATMGDIAAYCEARERLRPEVVERKEGEMTIAWRGSFQSEKYGHTELSLIANDLPRPRKVLMRDQDDSLHLRPRHSCSQTADGRLLINMPTTAKSLRLVW